MFELRLSYKEGTLEVIYLRCVNILKKKKLFSENNSFTFDKMITKFVLNAIFHHVGTSWIIIHNKEMKYEMDKNNHQYWLNEGPRYNTSICLKLHGSMFEVLLQVQEQIDIISCVL